MDDRLDDRLDHAQAERQDMHLGMVRPFKVA